MRCLSVFLLAAAVVSASFTTAADDKKDAKALPPIPTIDLKRTTPVDYAKDVAPIFENKCQVCHAGSVTKGKYDMSTYAGVIKGGKRGAAVKPGKSADSNMFLFRQMGWAAAAFASVIPPIATIGRRTAIQAV